MRTLTGVSLEVCLMDANTLLFTIDIDSYRAIANNRMRKLRDLIAQRQVWIEIMLAVKSAVLLWCSTQSKCSTHTQVHSFFVEYRQSTWQAETNVADQCVGVSITGVI